VETVYHPKPYRCGSKIDLSHMISVGISILYMMRQLGRSRYALFLVMTAPLSPPLLVLFLLAVTALLWRRSKQPHKDLPLPPGPKRWPFIGSLLQMPAAFEHETFREWNRQYGSYSFPQYSMTSISLLTDWAIRRLRYHLHKRAWRIDCCYR
jgi:hypothetical protein